MKKLLAIIVLGLLMSGNAYSKIFTWTCLKMPSKDFQIVFEINDKKKSIKHLSSYNYETKKKFEANKYNKILKFEKDFAWSYYDIAGDFGVRYNDFKNNKILQSTISPNNPKDFIYQSIDYECFVSN